MANAERQASSEPADNVSQTLPSAPSSLCFKKDEFMQTDFHVEEFIVECRRRVSLEALRDDLAVYLKILQSAMIELINKDYADFVNLSTNLVGMDKAINSLIHPLCQLRTDNLKVKDSMDDAILAVQDKLKKQADIRQKKATLQRLRSIIHSVEKMEKLLGVQQSNSSNPGPSELTGQLIERVATQFNKLQFMVNKSRGLPLVEDIKPRIAQITTTLQFSLEGSFREGLESSDIDKLRQCLRTYATIDKMRDAENLFRQHTVRPYMEEVINESFINENPNGLRGMFLAILDFIPKYCKVLDDATMGNLSGGAEVVRGYDFVVNAVWPEVVSNIEARTPSIFAPGNPNLFHERYLVSMEFIEKYEEACGCLASVRRLRAHPSYNTFMSKWSLPVYFQIRFQEIAGAFEGSLSSPIEPTKIATDGLYLSASQTLWHCIQQCWLPNTYLSALSHRFWKLSFQLVARYVSWLTELANTKLFKKPETSDTLGVSNGSGGKGHRRTGSYGGLSAHQRNSSFSNLKNGLGASDSSDKGSSENVSEAETEPPFTLTQVVYLLADIYTLHEKIPVFYTNTVEPLLLKLGSLDMAALRDGVKESSQSLFTVIPKFDAYITEEISSKCCTQLKNVNDIPRLYRRTNREKPSKPSTYVEGLVKPLRTFHADHHVLMTAEKKNVLSTHIMSTVCEQYLGITTDVLASVKKMEESLKRLKRAKGGTAPSDGKGLSDDDKIRLQFYLDVTELGKQMEEIDLQKTTLNFYTELFTLVENAKNGA